MGRRRVRAPGAGAAAVAAAAATWGVVESKIYFVGRLPAGVRVLIDDGGDGCERCGNGGGGISRN